MSSMKEISDNNLVQMIQENHKLSSECVIELRNRHNGLWIHMVSSKIKKNFSHVIENLETERDLVIYECAKRFDISKKCQFSTFFATNSRYFFLEVIKSAKKNDNIFDLFDDTNDEIESNAQYHLDFYEEDCRRELENSEIVNKIYSILSEKHRKIIDLYFFQNKTYKEIGEIMGGCSRQNIEQMMKGKILPKIKGFVEKELRALKVEDGNPID